MNKKPAQFLKIACEASLCAVVFFIPISIAITNIGIGAAILFWLMGKLFKGEKKILIDTPANIYLLIILVVSLLSFLNSIRVLSSVTGMVKLLKYTLLFFVIVETVDDWKKLTIVVWAAILGLFVVSADGIFQFAAKKDLFFQRPIGLGLQFRDEVVSPRLTASMHNSNDFAGYLITVIPLVLSLALYYFKGIKRCWLFLIFSMAFFCMFNTFQRSAGLGFIIVLLLFAFFKKDKITLLFLFLISALAVLSLPKSINDWAISNSNLYDFFVEKGGRRWHWEAAINMIKAHPILGVGINTFSISYEHYKSSSDPMVGWYAHNAYLNMAAEIGLLGLGVFLSMIVVVIRNWYGAFRKIVSIEMQAMHLGLFGSIIGYLVSGLLESNLQYSNPAVLFWFMFGLLVASTNLSKAALESSKN